MESLDWWWAILWLAAGIPPAILMVRVLVADRLSWQRVVDVGDVAILITLFVLIVIVGGLSLLALAIARLSNAEFWRKPVFVPKDEGGGA